VNTGCFNYRSQTSFVLLRHVQAGSPNFFVLLSFPWGMEGWGLFEGGGNAQSVICHFNYHMRALWEKWGSWGSEVEVRGSWGIC